VFLSVYFKATPTQLQSPEILNPSVPSDILVSLWRTQILPHLISVQIFCRFPLGKANGGSLTNLHRSIFRLYEPVAFVLSICFFTNSCTKIFTKGMCQIRTVICFSPLRGECTKELTFRANAIKLEGNWLFVKAELSPACSRLHNKLTRQTV
jgi:hypothetical protein